MNTSYEMEDHNISLPSRIISAISAVFSDIIRKYLPDPFIFAVLLTVITLILGMGLEDKSLVQMITYWGDGFWGLLSFAMQMVLVLMTGSVLAQAPLTQRGLNWLASIPKTPKGAIILATFFSGIACYINWGFGLIVGTLLAKKLAGRVAGVHYPLIIAAAYTAFSVYGLGVSASTPLLIATKGHFLEKQMGIIPISETIFHPIVIVMALALIVTLPIVNSMIRPKGKLVTYKEEEQAVAPEAQANATPAEKIETSPVTILLAGAMGLIFMGYYFFARNGKLDINMVNFFFLFIGMILHGTPRRFIGAINQSAKSVGSMIVQFPFYAGIMGMMAGSGLVTTIAGWFLLISTPQTLPFWGWVSSMFINFFVPSGGGHWVVQGPFMIEAANAMGANLAAVSMSVALGNAVQDIIQPMWILPALAISGLGIRDIMGYNIIAFLWACIIVGIGILAWGFI